MYNFIYFVFPAKMAASRDDRRDRWRAVRVGRASDR